MEFLRQWILFGLRPIPVSVAVCDIAFGIIAHDAARHAAGRTDEESGRREQRHLRIVGYFRDTAVQFIFRDAVCAVFLEDGGSGQELHRIAQRVSCGAADETALELIQITHYSPPLVKYDSANHT